uniref:G-protein coupled receptors family 1 profile domain-containing protein n=1 Tax=Anopheles farauti TaxID=69004 RepID=A0A182QU52_9DIPT
MVSLVIFLVLILVNNPQEKHTHSSRSRTLSPPPLTLTHLLPALLDTFLHMPNILFNIHNRTIALADSQYILHANTIMIYYLFSLKREANKNTHIHTHTRSITSRFRHHFFYAFYIHIYMCMCVCVRFFRNTPQRKLQPGLDFASSNLRSVRRIATNRRAEPRV